MTKKILEIQTKIDRLSADIEAHENLIAENESDCTNYEKILEQLTEQRNELAVCHSLGLSNADFLAEKTKQEKVARKKYGSRHDNKK